MTLSWPELSTVTRGKTTARILALLTSVPGQELHTREIVRRAGTTEHPTQRALTLLERQGLVRSRRLGNMRLWTMPQDHPLYGSLRELFARTVGIADQLRESLAKQPVDLAFIFGSYATGTDHRTSDIDLFVLGRLDWEKVHAIAGKVLRQLGRDLREVVWQSHDLRLAIATRSPFLDTLRDSPKIWVIGDDDEFRRHIGRLGGKVQRPGAEGDGRQARRGQQARAGAKERGSGKVQSRGRRSGPGAR